MKDVEDQPEFDGRNRGLALVVGLSPLWLLALLLLTPPPPGGPMYEPTGQVQARQLLVQFAIYALAGVLMLAGTVVLWRAQSTRAVVGAMCLLTLPALILVLLGPAFVLIITNATT